MRTSDIVVIGGGPAGLWTSYLLGRKGFKVILLERKSEIGSPIQCAGLVSEEVIKITGAKEAVLNEISEVEICGKSSRISMSSEVKAISIDRRAFDQVLAEKAASEGIEIKLKEGARKVEKGEVVSNYEKYSCEKIVVSEGSSSYFTRTLGLSGPKEFVYGVEFLERGKGEKIKIFLRKDLFPGFFGWAIPKGDLLLIGGASKRIFLENLETLEREIGGRGRIGIYSGAIPLGPSNSFEIEDLFFVGDCVGQVKATTGGGIYMDLRFSEALVEKISKGLRLPYSNIAYEELKEIQKDYLLYKWYSSLKQSSIDSLLEFLKENEDILKKYWKYDYHSKAIIPMLLFSKGKRKILKEGISMFCLLLRSILSRAFRRHFL